MRLNKQMSKEIIIMNEPFLHPTILQKFLDEEINVIDMPELDFYFDGELFLEQTDELIL